LAARAAGKKDDATSNHVRSSTPDISSGLTTEAFSVKRYPARQRRFEIRVYLLLDELTFHAALPSPTNPKQLVQRRL